MSEQKKFDFENVGFWFGKLNVPDLDSIEHMDHVSELAAHCHEEQIEAYMGNLSDDVMRITKMYAEYTCIENISVEKGDGFSVDILESGKKIANYEIDVYLYNDSDNDILPNGDPASSLKTYGWTEFEQLERLVQEQDAQFGADVAAIETMEKGIEQ